jgi:hypothetical protein
MRRGSVPGGQNISLLGLPETAVKENIHCIEWALANLGYLRHATGAEKEEECHMFPGCAPRIWALRKNPLRGYFHM